MTLALPEYRVDVKVRNNWLLRRMAERGMQTGADLARAAGVSLPAVYEMIGLKRAPIQKRNGDITPSALKVCAALNSSPGELWPPQHLEEPLKRNRASVEVTAADIGALIGQDHAPSPERILMDAQGIGYGIENALDCLTTREQDVIKRRYGLDGYEPERLDDIALSQNVTRERIRQIELKALRKARHRLKDCLHIESAEDFATW